MLNIGITLINIHKKKRIQHKQIFSGVTELTFLCWIVENLFLEFCFSMWKITFLNKFGDEILDLRLMFLVEGRLLKP